MSTSKKTTRKKTTRKKTTARKKKTTARKKKAPARKKKTTARKKAPARKKSPAAKKPARTPRTTATPGTTTPPSGTPPAARPPAAGSTGGTAGIRVRMYRVGFGDFFLLTVRAPDGTPRHILVDCGVHAANLGSIGAAIDQLAIDTGKQLALVIMTHRHADHISGFGTGAAVFAGFTVERVWMSWFEDPSDPAATNFQANITALAGKLQQSLAARSDEAGQQLFNMAENITGAAAVGGGNAAALATLHGGFKNKAPVDYYQAGDVPTLPDSLVQAGLTAQILGPPTDPALVAQMDNKPQQYLAATGEENAPPMRFNRVFTADASRYPPDAFAVFSPDEIAKHISSNQPDLLAAQAAKADNTINNQSLIVLFTFGGKKLLFAGDAQWGNWDNFLFGGAVVGDDTPLTANCKTILGSLDFYKVGHHGSTNASPIPAVNAMRDGCVAMCSTQPGAYGSVKNNSEVPRGPLIDALEKKTKNQLARADQVEVPNYPVDPTLEPLPAIFTKDDTKGYIDYEM
jgi:beta-lactamase superfamily II metal-dependent hydrolase